MFFGGDSISLLIFSWRNFICDKIFRLLQLPSSLNEEACSEGLEITNFSKAARSQGIILLFV